MNRPAVKSTLKSTILGLIFFLAFFGLATAVHGADSWLKIFSTGAEEMKTLEGKTFRAGYLVGSGLIQTKDKNYLAAAYVQGDVARPVDLALIKFDAAGTIMSYDEYGSKGEPFRADRVPGRDHQSYASIVETPDGEVVIAFGSTLMKVSRAGKPVWSKRYRARIPEERPDRKRPRSEDFVFKSISVQKKGDIIVCGLFRATAEKPPASPDTFAAKVRGADGVVEWAFEYPQLQDAERPVVRVLPDGGFVLGSEPKAVVKLNADGKVSWAKALEALPFKRGIKERPDVGSLLHYQTIDLMPNGDVIFSGVYNLSYVTYTAWGALLCRISSDGNSVRWAERVHSPLHGGETFIRGIVPSGDSFYAVGQSTEYGADEGWWNHNALVQHFSGSGGLSWVRSIGKKSRSEAKSEYREEQANAAVVGPDGGVIVAGSANSFAHPDPGFHRVIKWTQEHRDLLLTRLTSSGGIAGLPIGRWPKMLSAPDAGDAKKVEVLAVPIGLKKLDIEPRKIDMLNEEARYQLKEHDLQTQFDTTIAGAEGQLPVADFKVLAQKTEGDRFLRLDGTLSASPSGRGIVGYRWALSDTTPQVTLSGPKPVYNYRSAFSQDVTLVVEDSCGYESKPFTKKVVYGYIVRDKGIQPGISSGKAASYKVEILTGDVRDAGTNALVDVCLYGKPDDRGQRQMSGEAFLGPNVGTTASDCFERGQLDAFDLTNQNKEMKWNVDDVDYLSLRHTNRNAKDGWYVRGVKVTNLTTKKEWLFVPDRWLADDEDDGKTYGQFKPEETYPRGILIDGDTTSVGLTEASDNIFILPKDAVEFYFTPGVAGADLTVRSSAGVTLGSASTGTSAVLPFLKKAEWGVNSKTADITIPTRFAAALSQGGSERVKSVWVFPSNWAGYETEARRVALLYPMDGRTGVLNCGSKYRTFMEGRGREAAKIPDMSPIIDYGLAAFGIFADIPDERLEWYLEYNTEQYSKYKLDKVIGFLAKKTGDAAFAKMVSQYFDMLDLLVKARNWGERLPQVIAYTTNPVYGGDLVGDLGTNDANLKHAAWIMDALKGQMDALMAAVRGDPAKRISGNDPASCRTILNTIRMLCVGPKPSSVTASEHEIVGSSYGLQPEVKYPLAVILGQALSQIADWTKDGAVHPLFNNSYYSSIRKSVLNFDAHGATLYAMEVFEPAIRTMIQVCSPLIDASLTVDEKDSLWMK